MKKHYLYAFAGVTAAIAITTAMDATGYSIFSAFPLCGLIIFFWVLQRFSAREMGLRLGSPIHYLMAIAYPFSVMSILILLAFAGGQIDLSDANWKNVFLNVAAGSTIGTLIVMLTEEGFFRGWLWATLERAKCSQRRILFWTSLIFVVWHLSAIIIAEEFSVPLADVPIYLVNAFMMGAVWGLLRLISGSIVVASFCHALWNGLAYSLFGFGTKTGELGIKETTTYGPELGWIAIGLNIVFFAALWIWYTRNREKVLVERGPTDDGAD